MKEISVQDLKHMRDTGTNHQLVDVREEYEYEEMNIGAELICMGQIPECIGRLRKDVPVILHCRSGGRSSHVVKYLEGQGFDNVYNLKGGILAWREQIEPAVGKG